MSRWRTDFVLWISFTSPQTEKFITMATSVFYVVVAVFGIEDSKFRCSCEEHSICWFDLDHVTDFRFKNMVISSGKWKRAQGCLFTNSAYSVFTFTGNKKDTTIIADEWIFKGKSRSIVGKSWSQGYGDPTAFGRLHRAGCRDFFSFNMLKQESHFRCPQGPFLGWFHRNLLLRRPIDQLLLW